MDNDSGLKAFLAKREVRHDAAALLAGVDQSTIARICAGYSRARPTTVVKLAKALGTSARRMQALCDASYGSTETEEAMSQ